jgi:hypothetical protein
MKRLLRPFWSLTAPVRRPLSAKIGSFVTTCAARALEERGLDRALTEELTLTLDTLLAEQFRLREQVERLEQRVVELTEAPALGGDL